MARRVDSQAIAHHFLREDLVRDLFQFNFLAINGRNVFDLCHYSLAFSLTVSVFCSTSASCASEALRRRLMRLAMRSDCVPSTTCAILPRLITPEAPRLLRRVSSIWAGSLTKRRNRVIQPSTLCTF